jgi:hypothetical protein
VAVPILSTARATDGRGIDVRFMAHKGKPLLSAIRVRRK